MVLRSRMPDRAWLRVLGMGVALKVSTSTSFRSCLSLSLWATPNRCSSSTTAKPRFLNETSFCNRRWVPITMSNLPDLRFSKTSCCSLWVRNRLRTSTVMGKGARRSLKVA